MTARLRSHSPCALLFALAASALNTAAQPAAAGCMVLAGGGHSATTDAQENEGWNRLNFSFFDAALTALEGQGRVLPTFVTLGSDPAAATRNVMRQAASEGCAHLMVVSVFDDPSKIDGELVFTLRVAPLRAAAPAESAASGRAGPIDVGAPEYAREYRYAATPASLSKVVPSRIAEQAVRDYLETIKR